MPKWEGFGVAARVRFNYAPGKLKAWLEISI